MDEETLSETLSLTSVKRNNTLARQVYETLKRQILEGVLPPGTRLKDNELAAGLGVSSTPVREAVKRLESERLVETVPYVGSSVKQFSAQEVGDIYDVRIALESLAVRLTADSLTDAQIQRIEELVECYRRACEVGDQTSALQFDLGFHDLVAEASGNVTLQEMLRLLSAPIQMLRRLDRGTERMQQSLLDHQAILSALKKGDGDRAAELIEMHIERGKNHLLEIVTGRNRTYSQDG
jgi:DNA-binding GntR family transcriptional regulator